MRLIKTWVNEAGYLQQREIPQLEWLRTEEDMNTKPHEVNISADVLENTIEWAKGDLLVSSEGFDVLCSMARALATRIRELEEAIKHHEFIIDWYFNDNRPGNPLNHEQVIREMNSSMQGAIEVLNGAPYSRPKPNSLTKGSK